ncbi:MAG: type I-G CRISPR-associated protein, Cas3-extension family [Acidimicrobiales bacterium]
MNRITLPALRSDDSLGFMAALGALELLVNVEGLDALLGWEGLGGAAVLVVDLPGAEAVAERLRSVAVRLGEEGRLVPGDPSLVPARRSMAERRERKSLGIEEKNDPMRGTPAMVRDRLLAVAALEGAGDGLSPRWAAGLVTMLGLDRTGNCLLTPLYAPAGQQVLGQLLAKYLALAGQPGHLHEALVAWRRRPDSGANLDHRDLRDAAWSARGEPENASVPGATWLALMAAPLFRQTGDGRRGEAVGWARDRRSVRPRTLLWPVWDDPRSLPAVEVLLGHPEVRATERRPAALGALGVVAVCEARRTPLGNADGPLQPTAVVWP